MAKFKRKTVFMPAYDKRSADPKKNYGIHGVEIAMYLIGEKGVVQFRFNTGWQLPHVTEEFRHRPPIMDYPYGVDLGYHSPIPIYDEQRKMDSCPFFEDSCYYDGSGLQADDMVKVLIKDGSKEVWKKMKEYYYGVFDKSEDEKTWNDAGFGQFLEAICSAKKD